MLEECYDSNVITLKHAVKHIIRLLEVRTLHRNAAEFEQLFLDKLVPKLPSVNPKYGHRIDSLGFLIKCGTSIYKPPLSLIHRIGS